LYQQTQHKVLILIPLIELHHYLEFHIGN